MLLGTWVLADFEENVKQQSTIKLKKENKKTRRLLSKKKKAGLSAKTGAWNGRSLETSCKTI